MICGCFAKSMPGMAFNTPALDADWTTRIGMSGLAAPSMSASRANTPAPLCADGFTYVTNVRESAGASTSDQSIGETMPVRDEPDPLPIHVGEIRARREDVIHVLVVAPVLVPVIPEREDRGDTAGAGAAQGFEQHRARPVGQEHVGPEFPERLIEEEEELLGFEGIGMPAVVAPRQQHRDRHAGQEELDRRPADHPVFRASARIA